MNDNTTLPILDKGPRLSELPQPAETVNHPGHYNQVPGIECIAVVQHFNFNRGNAIKYIWRAGHKGDEIEDLRKAIKYLEFEIDRIKGL